VRGTSALFREIGHTTNRKLPGVGDEPMIECFVIPSLGTSAKVLLRHVISVSVILNSCDRTIANGE
jgi:hypothetical protein